VADNSQIRVVGNTSLPYTVSSSVEDLLTDGSIDVRMFREQEVVTWFYSNSTLFL
jgi:hypothetical protein